MNIVTVDVEDWFHICGGPFAEREWDGLPSRVEPTTERLLAMLDRAGVRATFFVVGWVAERFPALVDSIRSAGHDIGSHGYRHVRAYELGPEAFALDLRASLHALRAAGIDDVSAFRAPEWSINERSRWALDVLAREGITIDASMAPVRLVGDLRYPRGPHLHPTPHGALVEVPPLVSDRFGQVMPMWGWGLRYSSPARVLAAMAEANARGDAATLAVHPWELDPDPPRVRLSPRQWFAHYFCLAGFEARLLEILTRASFTTLAAVARSVRLAAEPCVPAA